MMNRKCRIYLATSITKTPRV